MNVLMCLVFLNGVYDVLCSMAIILHQWPILSSWYCLHAAEEFIHNYLHFSLFQDSRSMDSQLKRFLAYWIFTYGVIRIHTAMHSIFFSSIHIYSSLLVYSDEMLASMTYLIEALCFQSENILHDPAQLVTHKFQILISCCICIWLTLLFS